MAVFTSTASATSPIAPRARRKRERCSRKKRRPEKRRPRPKQPRSPARRSQTRKKRKTNLNHRKPTPTMEVRGETFLFVAPRPLPPLPPLLLSCNHGAGEVTHLRHHPRENIHSFRRRD